MMHQGIFSLERASPPSISSLLVSRKNPSPFPPDDRDLLVNRPVGQRLIVASAGVLANVVLSFALITTQVSTVGRIVQDYQPGVMVPAMKADSAARRAGIEVGDIIRAVRSVKTIVLERRSQCDLPHLSALVVHVTVATFCAEALTWLCAAHPGLAGRWQGRGGEQAERQLHGANYFR